MTTYGYDTEDNLTSINDANNNTTSFTYDAFGRGHHSISSTAASFSPLEGAMAVAHSFDFSFLRAGHEVRARFSFTQ